MSLLIFSKKNNFSKFSSILWCLNYLRITLIAKETKKMLGWTRSGRKTKWDFLARQIFVCFTVTGHGGHQHSLYFPEISENKAKSFLYNRHIRSLEINASPKPEYCTYLHPGYESWCERHITYCQVGVERLAKANRQHFLQNDKRIFEHWRRLWMMASYLDYKHQHNSINAIYSFWFVRLALSVTLSYYM